MRDPPRTLFLAVILLGHTAAIYLLSIRFERPQQRQNAEFASLPIRLMPLPEVPRTTAPRRGGVEQLVIGPTRPLDDPLDDVPHQPTERSETITLPSPEAESQAARDPISWIGQMQAGTGGWGEPDPGTMEFGLEAHQPDPEEPPSLNIFRSNSPRRAGYVEMLEPGVERRWVSSRCYREFGKPSLVIPGTRPDLNPLTCLTGKGPVRDDLFDHLKPDYLKQED